MKPFKKSEKYDLNWMKDHEMGPNSVWLTEFLTEGMDLRPGMRVLDLGCGKAMSSIFLAKEFQVQVWACDLWISPSENYQNANSQKVSNLVYPIYAEAHQLPFAKDFFDAIVSVDTYHYFGTDDYYLPYLMQFLRKDGILGMVSPGLKQEIKKVPSTLEKFWEPQFYCFHTVDWWKNHWQKTGLVNILTADILRNGWKIWYQWEKELMKTHARQIEKRGNDINMLEADNGDFFCFPRIIGRKIAG